MSIFLIILIVLWAFVIFRSFRRGFVKSTLSLLLFFIFIFFVRTFSPSMENLLSGSENVRNWASEQCESYVRGQIDKSMENGSWTWLQGIELPEEAQAVLQAVGGEDYGTVIQIAGEDAVASAAVSYMTPLLIRILSYLVTALISFAVLLAVDIVVGCMARGKEFAGVNRFLGLVVGLVKCLFYTWAVFTVIGLLSVIGIGDNLLNDIAANPLLAGIASVNPLPSWIGQALINLLKG